MNTENIPDRHLVAGGMISMRLGRHRLLRLTALDAGANVSALVFNSGNFPDRLNIPDTLKALHTAKLTRGHVLMSDMGHALMSITDDTLGWHDPLGGHILPEAVRSKFGGATYQSVRNAFHRNARDNFLIELGKHGLGLRDIVANINFFSKVVADDAGGISFVADHCVAGSSVELRTEMPVLLVLSNTPHPMHPAGNYPSARVGISIAPTAPPGPDDFCRRFRPECARVMTLTEELFI